MFESSCRKETSKRIGVLSSRRRPRLLIALTIALGFAAPAPASAQVFWYHPTIFFPEQFQWQRIVSGTPERRLEDGWLIETVEYGDKDLYRYDVGFSSLVGRFFVEWRAVTDYPESLIYELQVPAVVVAGGNAGSVYHVVMTESAAVLSFFYAPWVVVPITPGVHTYRIEVYTDVYVWYIDGLVVDSGVPYGPYPDPNAEIVWGVHSYEGMTNTTAFDYLRFGEIPQDASGDYNSSGSVSPVDYRFVRECLTKAGPDLFGGPVGSGPGAGPGCAFTDFDADSDVDLFDIAEFQNHFTGSQ